VNPQLDQIVQISRAVESQVRAHPRVAGGIVTGVAASIGITLVVLHLRRPSAFEVERQRRNTIVQTGRITDGVILDARTLAGEDSTSPTPEVLLYSYRVAGVTYNCGQDVSSLPDMVLGYRLDQTIQVRYDPRNPGNSILVADEWTGLWQRNG
jgi:hypothetical protein